jgi:hypothetical protein
LTVPAFSPIPYIMLFSDVKTLEFPKTGRWNFVRRPVDQPRLSGWSCPFTGTAENATNPLLTSVIQT